MPYTVELRSLADRVEIAEGVLMPRLGVGTYKAKAGYEVEQEVGWALEVGYRGIDTAALYGNEDGVGRAIAAGGIPRDELFVATKVWNDDQGYATTRAAFRESLSKLALDYVDLYLMHWPIPSLMEDTWRAMQEIHAVGAARAIGVCNFLPHHLERLLSFAEVPPAVDQVEFHPGLQQPDLMWYLHDHGIVQQAWAPVMRGRVYDIPVLVRIAEKHGKSPAQVSIRWILQKGVTTIPKSVHRERLAENADVYDFDLSAEEMAAIDALDRDERIGPHPDRYEGR
ncbi:MAG TPA: aldo/keto reductase [Coriobacteriia bacterium]|jgi:diketogulonate reductase-like aldo/keto reductase